MSSVQEAAARLRRIHKGDSPIDVYGFDPNVNDRNDPYVLDLRFALGQWLELVPADDTEPITPEFLKSVGFAKPNAHCPFIFSMFSAADDDVRLSYWLENNGVPEMAMEIGEVEFKIPQPKTRGQIRQLAACLGIPLSEEPT